MTRRCSGRARASDSRGPFFATFWLSLFISGHAVAVEKRTVVADENYRPKGKFFHTVLGTGYRALWGAPVEIDVLDLRTYAGGLRPVRRVGGLQTASLAMVGADGRNYTFRPLKKDAAGLLPEEYRGTPVDELVTDQMFAQHPAGAIVASRLSEAVGVLEARQSLVVMPDDELLGEFRQDYRGVLGTIAVYPSPVSDTNPGYMGATEIFSTPDMWSVYISDPDRRPDVRTYLKARLLDLFVGDWDRHEGQWRWATIPGQTGLQPIAEDRDQAFSNYDGMVMAIARLSGLPQFSTFKESYPSTFGLSFNAWPVDRLILVSLEWNDWKALAEDLQERLTDEAIDSALGRMPREYFEISGVSLRERLLARRSKWVQEARRFYLLLAGEVDVFCTDLNETVEIERASGDKLTLQITREGSQSPYYERVFQAEDTREVRVYLSGGVHRILSRGLARGGSRVYLIGNGPQPIEGSADRIVYIDQDSEGLVETFEDKRALYGVPNPNEDAPWSHPIDWGNLTVPLILLDYRTDASLILGGGVEKRKFAFDKSPYAWRQVLRGAWAVGVGRPIVQYEGEFRNRRYAPFLSVHAEVSGVSMLRYYGFGNETDGKEIKSRYRTENTRFTFFPALTWSKGVVFHVPGFTDPPDRSTTFRIGPIFKYNDSRGDPGTLLDEERPFGFGGFSQLGVGASFLHDGREERKLLATGFRVGLDAFYYFQAWDVESRFGSVEGKAAGYLPVGNRLQVATAIEGKHVFGDFPFFEGAFLGGRDSIRGYKPDRYLGNSSLLGSAELRLRAARLHYPIPGTVGVLAGAEVGRVFYSEEESGRWHPAAGGGVFFEMLRGYSVFSFSVWRGRDDFTFHLKAGFDF